MVDLANVLRNRGIDCSTLERLDGFGDDILHRLVVNGNEGVSLWQRLRSIADETEHWPVILGDDETVARIQEFSRFEDQDSAKTVADGEAMSPAAWLASERDIKAKWKAIVADPSVPSFLKESYQRLLTELENAPPAPPAQPEPWPEDVTPNTEFITPYNLDGIITRLSIGLIPVRVPWHVPAVLRFGNFNSCPHPSVHVCMLKHWSQSHGAELVAMTSDTIELSVARPPTTREDATALDEDHATYCGESYQQGGFTPKQMRGRLLRGTVWYFWWD